MSTALDTTVEPVEASTGTGLGRVAAMAAVAVLLQVTIFGQLVTAPNLVVVVVVAVAMWRGVVVGAVTGFAAGLLVELMTPGDTLGVLALAYVAVGAWCGRFAERAEPPRPVVFVFAAALAAAVIPIWMGAIGVLRGDPLDLGFLLGHLAAKHLLLALLVAWPVWWTGRRVLGAPRVVEPWVGAT